MSKIIRFTAENVKKIKAVEIFPEDFDNVVIITGENRVGKSSIIECIWMAIEGAAFKFSKPMNNTMTDEDESFIELELEDIIIRRHWTSNDKSYLNILTKDGARYPSPQAMLDKMKGAISLDPAEFQLIGRLNDGDKKQVEYLIKALNINTKTIDIKFKTVYDERTLVNREHTRIKALLKDLPEPEVNLPDEEISVLDITAEIQKANDWNNTIDKALQLIKDYEKEINTNIENRNDTIDEIDKLKAKIAELETKEVRLLGNINTLRADHEKLLEDVSNKEKIDVNSFQVQIEEAETTNQKIRARNKRAELENEMGDLFEEVNTKTGELEDLKKKKAELISKANFPIEGLYYDENGIFVNEIPFNQLSESEQFKFSTLIAMAANPELRVIASKHGGLFDEKNLALLIELIKDKDYQLWLEKVEETKLPSVIIEEGRIKSVRKK